MIVTMIVAECPICLWRSPAFKLEDRPNAHWFACQRAREVFQAHAWIHLQPRFIEVNATGDTPPSTRLGDLTRRVWCASGAHRAPAEGAEVVKASTPSGWAWRCSTCGERERARIRAVNREVLGSDE